MQENVARFRSPEAIEAPADVAAVRRMLKEVNEDPRVIHAEIITHLGRWLDAIGYSSDSAWVYDRIEATLRDAKREAR